jgi:hypothetical protein
MAISITTQNKIKREFIATSEKLGMRDAALLAIILVVGHRKKFIFNISTSTLHNL